MKVMEAGKPRMLPQRLEPEIRLKSRPQKGLTCPERDAYDWLFVCVLYDVL